MIQTENKLKNEYIETVKLAVEDVNKSNQDKAYELKGEWKSYYNELRSMAGDKGIKMDTEEVLDANVSLIEFSVRVNVHI